MSKVQSIKIEDIVIDGSIYPRINIDHKRVSMNYSGDAHKIIS